MTRSSHREATGQRHLRSARQDFTTGRFAATAGDASGELSLRRALQSYWSAMNWLEDTPAFDVAHTELHEAGRFTRETFPEGCRPEPKDGGGFVQRCPVFLAHKRFGLSIGATGNAICSICGGDASECPHIPGRTYDVEAGRQDGRCNVCAELKCSDHVTGHHYDAEARVIVTEADLREISIVPRPAQPDARITQVDIGPEKVEEVFGPLPSGTRINCDKCLYACTGFDYLPSSRGPSSR